MGSWAPGIWIAVAVVAAVVVYLLGYAVGKHSPDRDVSPEAGPRPEEESLVGSDVPVREAELGFLATLPQTVLIVDAFGTVLFDGWAGVNRPYGDRLDIYRPHDDPGPSNAGGVASGGSHIGESMDGRSLVHGALVSSGRIASPELSDLLAQVVADGVQRERELRVDQRLVGQPAASGRGIRVGDPSPSTTTYLQVRVGHIADGLFAILLSDVSERRRFEAMRRDFVSNVSHELKTPAGAISLLAETIGDAADDPEAVRYFAGRIAKESERLTELVHRLIDLQKAQSARAIIDARRLDALAVARKAIAENKVQADARHINLMLSADGRSMPLEGASDTSGASGASDVPGDRPEPNLPIMADEESITTAVKNLVENAIHYSPEATTVRVVLAHGNGKVTIRVIDQGIGIPRRDLSRVFERFYRVDPARSRETGGTGLGLSIVKHCVQDCGGTVSVWSHEGEGSTFTIELPEAAEKPGATGRSETPEASGPAESPEAGGIPKTMEAPKPAEPAERHEPAEPSGITEPSEMAATAA